MKKLKFLLIMVMFALIPFVSVSAKEKINVYMFRGEGCPHCEEAEKWFKELEKDKEYVSYYNLIDYEVWYDEENADLMEDVAEKLDTTANGVPFMVIGEKYFNGFTESMESDIKRAIKEAYNSVDYVDVVKGVKNGTYNKDTNKKSYDEFSNSDDSTNDDKKTNEDKYDEADEFFDEFDEMSETFFDRFGEYAEKFFGLGGDEFTALFAVIAVYIIIILFIVSIVQIFFIICKWKIYLKAGKNGWEAIIPYYSSWTFFEISGYPGWIALIALAGVIPYVSYLVSIVLFVFKIMASLSLAKKFHKSEGFGVLLALLPIVGLPILAFGSDTYDGSLGQQNGISMNEEAEVKEEKKESKTNKKYCSNCGKEIKNNNKYCSNCGSEL